MRKIFGVFLAVVFVLTLNFGNALALDSADGQKLYGKHWQFNLIGTKQSISGDYGNGRAIMIPLKTVRSNGPLECADGVVVTDDEDPTYQNAAPSNGVKLIFTAGDDNQDFEIVDRDATDGEAEIVIPTYDVSGEPYLAVDVFVRVLGKPLQCMHINGYAEDQTQGLWFWSGSVTLKRKPGKSLFYKVNDLFLVWWCDVDPITELCIQDTEAEISVFDSLFAEYFWNIENDGTRIVQVRLYPRTTPYLPPQ